MKVELLEDSSGEEFVAVDGMPLSARTDYEKGRVMVRLAGAQKLIADAMAAVAKSVFPLCTETKIQ